MGQSSRDHETLRQEAIGWLNRLRSDPDADTLQAFEDWYAASQEHADTYDSVLGNWEKTGLLVDEENINTPQAAGQSTGGHWGRLIVAIAAALCLILAAIGFYRAGYLGLGSKDPTQLASQTGEIRTTTLSDGSKIILDTDSLVSVHYDGKERHLELLRGRARFEVAHERDRPFIVSAGDGEIIAHGTIFDVAVHGEAMSVGLLRGSIEIRRHHKGDDRQYLRPGQKLAFVTAENGATPTNMPPEESRWITGVLSFRNTPLPELLAQANRYAIHPIRLGHGDMNNLRFTGTVDLRATERLARLLSETFSLELTKAADDGWVLSRSR